MKKKRTETLCVACLPSKIFLPCSAQPVLLPVPHMTCASSCSLISPSPLLLPLLPAPLILYHALCCMPSQF